MQPGATVYRAFQSAEEHGGARVNKFTPNTLCIFIDYHYKYNATPARKNIVTHFVTFLNALNNYEILMEEECLWLYNKPSMITKTVKIALQLSFIIIYCFFFKFSPDFFTEMRYNVLSYQVSNYMRVNGMCWIQKIKYEHTYIDIHSTHALSPKG
jgi:hypothetical protein